MSQTYNNIEIVISDNNSSDDSKKIILEEKKKNPKIKVNFFNKNLGVIKNVLKTIEMSTGDYFFYISPGDKISKKICGRMHASTYE